MSRVSIQDPELGAMFAAAIEPLEVFDNETGLVVGQYFPASFRGKLIRPEDECPISEDELLRRYREEKTGRTLPEIWKSLGREE
jgi:hypothetical protein